MRKNFIGVFELFPVLWAIYLIGNAISYRVESDKDAVAYLTYYGYVDPDEMPLGFTLKDCNKKLKEFQAKAKVEVTGELDRDTLKAMNMPRCGCPDFMKFSFKHSEGEDGSNELDHRHSHHQHNHYHHGHRLHNHNHTLWSRRNPVERSRIFTRNNNGTVLRMPEAFTVTTQKWEKPLLTYSIMEYPSRPNMKISPMEIENVIHKAFRVWEEQTNLEFSYEPNNINVDIEIRFVSAYHGDNSPFDGPGNALAHAFFPGSGIGGDVHFEQDEDWTIGSYNGVDVLYVAVHEIGHSLGLGHSDDYGSIMYPMYRGFLPNLQLHSDDIRGVQTLYGTKYNRPPRTTTVRPTRPTVLTTRSTPFTTKRPVRSTTLTPPQTTRTPPSNPGDGGLCDHDDYDLGIDAATTMLGGAILIFKGTNVYEVGKNGEGVLPGWPRKISQYFKGLEGNIDAVITRTNGKTYFFKGARYWRFTGTQMDVGYPRSILEYFPGIPTDLDAAFEWDREFVFTKGNYFWRFNTRTRPQVHSQFPWHLNHWGLENKLDAAFTAPNGTTYFFQDQYYWEFDKNLHKVKNDVHRAYISEKWFGCWEP